MTPTLSPRIDRGGCDRLPSRSSRPLGRLRVSLTKGAVYGFFGCGQCLIDCSREGSVPAFEHDRRQSLQHDLDPAHAIDATSRADHVFRPNADPLNGSRKSSKPLAKPLPDVGPIAHTEVALARADAHGYLGSTHPRHPSRDLWEYLWKPHFPHASRPAWMAASC